MGVRLSSSSAIVGRHRGLLLDRVKRTRAYVRLRLVHTGAAALFWGLATDGPFGSANPAAAVREGRRFYRRHGFDLPKTEALEEFARFTAAGQVAEEDVARRFKQWAVRVNRRGASRR